MGLVTSIRMDAAEAARRDAEQGRAVFVYRYNMPNGAGTISTDVRGAADCIEAIEAAGWRLSAFSASQQSRHGSLVMIFRRA